jgi:hypothetical protein
MALDELNTQVMGLIAQLSGVELGDLNEETDLM